MTLETNRIKEIDPGVYWTLLSFPESSLLTQLLDPNTKYVLCWNHTVGNFAWRRFRAPLVRPDQPLDFLSRVIQFDFILETEPFIKLLSDIGPAIKAVQLNHIPPDYLDMDKVKGRQLYRVLRECGWHVLLDTPGNDYGQLMSPKKEVLERAIEIVQETNQREKSPRPLL
jgi:hypothetical protein